jgi:RNA polymerase sigma factor (TIGR02999 family)
VDARAQAEITQLARAAVGGDADAEARLAAGLMTRLRATARSLLAGERAETSNRPTALADDAFMKLVRSSKPPEITDRDHLYRLLTLAMKRIIIDRAKWRRAQRRGGGAAHVDLQAAEADALSRSVERDYSPDEMGALLQELEAMRSEISTSNNARLKRIFEAIQLRYLVGIERAEEVAAALGVSTPTVNRDLRFGLAVLRTRVEKRLATPTDDQAE